MSGDTPISVFDERSDVFKEIEAKAQSKDSECAYGPEFLVWIPALEVFAGLFMGSKTARGESPKILDLLKKGVTLTSQIIEKNGYIWEGIVAQPCTTPFKIPTVEALQLAITKFNKEATAKPPEKADTKTTERNR
jgi:hypothetical protein